MNIKNINYEYFLDLSVRMTHHSNAIEGNTLTLNETATIILDSTIPGSKSVREVFEVLNHKRAIDYMISELENDKKLDIYVIKSINKEILDRLNDNAGNFKRNSNAIIGANFETSTPSQAPILTKNWIEKNDRALYMNYLREQNTDIIFDKVKELQEFEKRRMEQF